MNTRRINAKQNLQATGRLAALACAKGMHVEMRQHQLVRAVGAFSGYCFSAIVRGLRAASKAFCALWSPQAHREPLMGRLVL